MTTDMDPEFDVTEPLSPDRSLAGQPLFLHINNKGIDDDVEKAATIAATEAGVPIIAVRFTADPGLRQFVNRWLNRQRDALKAWKAQQGIIDRSGRLSLRSGTFTDVETGSDWVWAYVRWDPTKANHA